MDILDYALRVYWRALPNFEDSLLSTTPDTYLVLPWGNRRLKQAYRSSSTLHRTGANQELLEDARGTTGADASDNLNDQLNALADVLETEAKHHAFAASIHLVAFALEDQRQLRIDPAPLVRLSQLERPVSLQFASVGFPVEGFNQVASVLHSGQTVWQDVMYLWSFFANTDAWPEEMRDQLKAFPRTTPFYHILLLDSGPATLQALETSLYDEDIADGYREMRDSLSSN